jgi:hypothetical protein
MSKPKILVPVPHRHWTCSIPRVLRDLIERDRKLLGLLAQSAYAAILKNFQVLCGHTDVRGRIPALGRRNPHGLQRHGAVGVPGELLIRGTIPS